MKRNLVFFIAIAVLMVAMLTFAACNFEPKCVASHTWDDGTVIVAPTCKTEGQMKYTCKVCGAVKKETIEKIPHTEGGWIVDSAPTCTDAGHRHTECTVCQVHVQEEDMLALDHDFGAWAVTTPATCTTKGEEERVCQREGCGHKETREINALDHDFGAWAVTTPATCTTKGEEERVCQREGCEHKETREINTLGHHLVDKHDGTHHWQECDREGCEYATSKVAHTESDWIVDSLVNCTDAGHKHTECTVCHTHMQEEDLPALGHDWGEWVVKKPATCTANGVEARTCERCQYTMFREIRATGHTEGEWVVDSEPTCTAVGHKHTECSVCHAHIQEADIAAKGHSYNKETDWIAEVPATCTAEGTKGHYHCDTCNKDYDKEGNELTNLTILASGHDYQAVVTPPTCTERGYTTHTCSRCNDSFVDTYVDALGHDWGEWEQTKAPTCTENGEEQRVCAYDATHIETRDIEAKGHTEGDWTVDVEPTCTEAGHKHQVCVVCGETIDTATVDALGHHLVWDHSDTEHWQVCDREGCNHATTHEGHNIVTSGGKEPTCTEPGHTAGESCSICGYLKSAAEIPATGHEWGQWTQTKAPTCTEKGEEQRVCAHDATHVETRPVAALGHSYKETDWIAEVPATCTQEGKLGHYHCDACNKNFDKEGNELSSLTIPANGHDYQAVVTEPTCTENGYTTHTCAVCGDHYDDTYVDALGHDWGEWEQTKAPTCTENGEEQRVCKHNATHVETRPIKATGHTEGEWIVDTKPTCTEAGHKYQVCAVCGETIKEESIGALGHSYNTENIVWSWAEDHSSATATLTCGACGEEVDGHTITIDATISSETLDANCTESGLNEYTATVVFEEKEYTNVVDVDIPARGHSWNDGEVTKAPTCTEKGIITYTCTACRATRTEEIDMVAHTLETVAEQPATCENAGHVQHQRCTVCGKLFSMEGNEKTEADLRIEPIGHNWGDWTQTKAPTCTGKGEETRTCQREGCNHTESQDVAALGHDLIHHDGQAPTCTEAGWAEYDTCSRCDYTTYQAIEATGHTESGWIVDVEPNCTTGGHRYTECTVCHVPLQEEDLTALGHSWGEGEVTTEPTCQDTGVMTYKCTRCGETKTETIPVDESKHNLQEETNGYCSWVECTTCGKAYISAAQPPVTLSFADVANRESQDENQQVWKQNGITFTNDKAASTTNVNSEVNPVRLYAHSSVTIEYAGMTKIVFNCNTTGYANDLKNTIGDAATVNGKVVTVVFATPQDSFSIADLNKQVRLDSIEVTALGKVELCAEHTFGDWEVVKDATCTEAGEHKHTCTVCGFVEGEEIAQLEHKAAEGAEWIVDEENSTHYHKCATCDTVRLDEASHSTENGIHSDETQHWYECDVCGHHYEVADHKDNDVDGNCDVCGKEMLTEEEKEALLQQQLADAVADLKGESKLPKVEYDENNNAIITLPTLSEGIKATIEWIADANDAVFNEDGTVTIPQTDTSTALSPRLLLSMQRRSSL